MTRHTQYRARKILNESEALVPPGHYRTPIGTDTLPVKGNHRRADAMTRSAQNCL